MSLRVAVVGAGPSGVYAVGHLLEPRVGTFLDGTFVRRCPPGIEVDLIDRLPTPWGLVRGGVAPDHPEKKAIAGLFTRIVDDERVRFLGGIEVGRDVHPADLRRWYDAVIYASGASTGRTLGVPGADLPGSHTAHDVVGWYNGHPDHARLGVDLAVRRAVVIGNGNVALDVARFLARSPDALAGTDVADHALAAARASTVREVVVVGRRDPWQAAFGDAELEELVDLPGVEVRCHPRAGRWRAPGPAHRRRRDALAALAARPAAPRRLTLLFHRSPRRVLGVDRVIGVELATTRRGRRSRAVIDAGLVVAAIGSRARPVPGLPFDEARGVVPTVDHRVVDGTEVVPGAYATGWVARGPTGVIGTNKACARDAVGALLADAAADRLPRAGTLDGAAVLRELTGACPGSTSWAGWERLDAHERALGLGAGRPRVKLTDVDAMRAVARTASVSGDRRPSRGSG